MNKLERRRKELTHDLYKYLHETLLVFVNSNKANTPDRIVATCIFDASHAFLASTTKDLLHSIVDECQIIEAAKEFKSESIKLLTRYYDEQLLNTKENKE